jgi:hypothetical protein
MVCQSINKRRGIRITHNSISPHIESVRVKAEVPIGRGMIKTSQLWMARALSDGVFVLKFLNDRYQLGIEGFLKCS